LIEHILGGGVHGLFVLGSTGEGPSLSLELWAEVLRQSCARVAGRVPVLVGISHTCFSTTLRFASLAKEAGASGLVLAPPYYLFAGQPDLLAYLEHLLPQLPLPVLLYNAPSFTKLSFQPETVRRALGLPNLVGLKDSSGDRIYFHHLRFALRDHPEFSLLTGPEELLVDTLAAGGHGGVCGGANVWPQLYVGLYNSVNSGDRERTRTLHDIVMRVNSTVYRVGISPSHLIREFKCALSIMGICQDLMAEPFQRFTAEERENMRRCLEELASLDPIVMSYRVAPSGR
jgi:4-hydroxy-tetrahydrodipicolinate synthase